MAVDCKTGGFFLKISKEIGKAWRKSLTRAKRASLTRPTHSPVSLSVFRFVPDLLFDCSRVVEYAKIRTVLQSKMAGLAPTFEYIHALFCPAGGIFVHGNSLELFNFFAEISGNLAESTFCTF